MQRLACPGARRAPFRGRALVGFTILEARIAFAELFVAGGFGFRVWSGLRPASFIAGGCVKAGKYLHRSGRGACRRPRRRRCGPLGERPGRAAGHNSWLQPRSRPPVAAPGGLAAGCGRAGRGLRHAVLAGALDRRAALAACCAPAGRHARARAARHHARARPGMRASNRPTNQTNAGTHAF